VSSRAPTVDVSSRATTPRRSAIRFVCRRSWASRVAWTAFDQGVVAMLQANVDRFCPVQSNL
jgi:hypothetical protein